MAHFLPILNVKRLIDCNDRPHLLADWPVAARIFASETAEMLMLDLDPEWVLSGADLGAKPYEIDAENRSICINNEGLCKGTIARSHYFQNVLTLRSFAALRATWQAERLDDALAMHRLDLWPLINRVVAADIASMTLRMAHETRAEGNDSLWRHVLGDEGGDMAVEYARHQEAGAFLQWFKRDARITKCDFETLADMDGCLASLTMQGQGNIGEGALKCLTIDPIAGSSYLGLIASEIAGNPAWRTIKDQVVEAHFVQIMDELGATRVGYVAMRDRKLAARLFPDALINA